MSTTQQVKDQLGHVHDMRASVVSCVRGQDKFHAEIERLRVAMQELADMTPCKSKEWEARRLARVVETHEFIVKGA